MELKIISNNQNYTELRKASLKKAKDLFYDKNPENNECRKKNN